MKIFTTTQIRELDRYTMEHEPIASIDLMERAAKTLAQDIMTHHTTMTPIIVFAGPGNNGGDALAVARIMAEENYKVSVYLFNIHNKLSEDCAANKQRLINNKQIEVFKEITLNFDPPKLTADMLVIDGLFGVGLDRPLTGGFASLVKYINQSPCKVVSIDIPSGLMSEDNTMNVEDNIIRADVTLTLQQKKLAMMFADNQQFLGKIVVLDIRLSSKFIRKTDTVHSIISENDLRPILKKRHDFAHKGSMGNALLIAGKYGMCGASVLSAMACLRGGCGKVTVRIPRLNYNILSAAVPEAVVDLDEEDEFFSQAIDSSPFDAVGIGPGIGQDEYTAIAMIAQIRRTKCPLVADADALTILGTHQAWLQQLPQDIILTPHPKEFDVLSGKNFDSDFQRLHAAMVLAKHIEGYIILKGHNSALCLPNGKVIFNSTGNSGMATAGSGDVLTGLITSLLARGYSQKDACLLGMYLHGLAGDLGIKDLGKESLIARDIINYLPKAFNRLNE